jgi:[acyl-carrier-protein] S-malonyltransferase
MSTTALLFPGQGSQYSGMGHDLYTASEAARARFAEADRLLGFGLSEIMFKGSAEDLTRTSVTQPAIYVHSVILAEVLGLADQAHMAAGHSLGEFSALAVAGVFSFENGLRLVAERAAAMQAACDAQPSTMAAIVGLDDATVEAICNDVEGIVVPANYNAPGQLVISGATAAVEAAVELAKSRGARLAKLLQVNGAFHSPLMQPAQERLAAAIAQTSFSAARFPVYQNASARPTTDPDTIRQLLTEQLTAPVRWTQSIGQMAADGAVRFIEVGPGKVLQGLVKRIASEAEVESISTLNA